MRPILRPVVAFTLLIAFIAVAARADDATPSGKDFSGTSPLGWSVRMANSEIARRGDGLAWKDGGRAKWDYTAGLFTLSLLKLDERVHNPAYLPFVQSAIGSFIDADGNIQGYRMEDYNLDNINPGKTVLALYHLTKE